MAHGQERTGASQLLGEEGLLGLGGKGEEIGVDPPNPEEFRRCLQEFPGLLPQVQGRKLQAEGEKAGLEGTEEGGRHLFQAHGGQALLRHPQGSQKLLRARLTLLQAGIKPGEEPPVGLPGEALRSLPSLPHPPGHGNFSFGKGKVPHQVFQFQQKSLPGHLARISGGKGGHLRGDEGVAIPVPSDPAPEAHRALQAGTFAIDLLQGGLEALHHPGYRLPEGGGQVVKPALDLVLHRGPGLAHLLGGVEQGHPGRQAGTVLGLQLLL
ncbi:hypothetical protein HRbin38_00435 [bacterium HR38]|nr:hypothetical protein HRbin38_00435 [bacterium HR38]